MRTYHEKRSAFGTVSRFAAVVFPENYMLRTARERIVSPKLPEAFDGFRIVQISDLHGCRFGKENRRLLEKTEAEKPDIITVTGDIADRKTKNFTPIFNLVKTLCGKYPVYFVSGNHELEMPGDRRTEFLNGLCAQGVCMLDNRAEKLGRGGASITLCGVRVPLRYYRWNRHGKRRPVFDEKEMKWLLGACGPEYTILLAHNPLFFESYAAWGADLTLCGHIHGGMVRLPRLGGLLSPERNFFPRYSAGLYHIGEHSMAVSCGLSKGPRINNPPEIVSLTLCCAPACGNGSNP